MRIACSRMINGNASTIFMMCINALSRSDNREMGIGKIRSLVQMHGGDERALEAFRRGLRAGPATSPASGDAMQLRLRAEAVALGAQRGGAIRTMHGADRVVRVAFFLNAMDATSKFAAAYVTG